MQKNLDNQRWVSMDTYNCMIWGMHRQNQQNIYIFFWEVDVYIKRAFLLLQIVNAVYANNSIYSAGYTFILCQRKSQKDVLVSLLLSIRRALPYQIGKTALHFTRICSAVSCSSPHNRQTGSMFAPRLHRFTFVGSASLHVFHIKLRTLGITFILHTLFHSTGATLLYGLLWCMREYFDKAAE